MELAIADLRPFLPWLEAVLNDEAVAAVLVNGPGAVFGERAGRISAQEALVLTSEAVAWAAIQHHPPAGRGPEDRPDHRRAAGRRLARCGVQPARDAGNGDHDSAASAAGFADRGAEAERIASRAWSTAPRPCSALRATW